MKWGRRKKRGRCGTWEGGCCGWHGWDLLRNEHTLDEVDDGLARHQVSSKHLHRRGQVVVLCVLGVMCCCIGGEMGTKGGRAGRATASWCTQAGGRLDRLPAECRGGDRRAPP